MDRMIGANDRPYYGLSFVNDYLDRSGRERPFNFKRPCFLIDINMGFIKELKVNPERQIFKIIEDCFGFNDCKLDFIGDVGFEGVIENHGQNECAFVERNSVSFVVYLPLKRIYRYKNYECPVCKDFVRKSEHDKGCPSCLYTGAEHIDNPNIQREIDLVSASLAVLFNLLRYSQSKTSSIQHKLLDIEMIVGDQFGETNLYGTFNQVFLNYFDKQNGFFMKEIIDAMWCAHTHMVESPDALKREKFKSLFYQTKYDEDQLILSCPADHQGGNTSFLYTTEKGGGIGCNFHSKSVTSSAGLVLLAALMRMHQEVRQYTWIKEQ